MVNKRNTFIKRWWCHCADCHHDSRDYGGIYPTKERLIDWIKNRSDWKLVDRQTTLCPDCLEE